MDAPEGASVRQLIVHLGFADRPVAVEVNETLVSRREHEAKVLAPGDAVELVTLVGGG